MAKKKATRRRRIRPERFGDTSLDFIEVRDAKGKVMNPKLSGEKPVEAKP